jgi:hypothetical protein
MVVRLRPEYLGIFFCRRGEVPAAPQYPPLHDDVSSGQFEGRCSSLLLLQEGICYFLAAVDWGYYDEEGAAGDDEAEFSVADIAFFV